MQEITGPFAALRVTRTRNVQNDECVIRKITGFFAALRKTETQNVTGSFSLLASGRRRWKKEDQPFGWSSLLRVPGLEPGAFWFVAKRSIQLGYIRVLFLLSSLVDGSKYRIIEIYVKGKGRKKWKFLRNKLFVRFLRLLRGSGRIFNRIFSIFNHFPAHSQLHFSHSRPHFPLISSALVWTTFTI